MFCSLCFCADAYFLRFDNNRHLKRKADLLKKTTVIWQQMDRHLEELAITRKTQTQQQNHENQFKDDQKKVKNIYSYNTYQHRYLLHHILLTRCKHVAL